MPSITGPVSAVRAAHVLDSAAARQKFAAHHQDANRQALYDRSVHAHSLMCATAMSFTTKIAQDQLCFFCTLLQVVCVLNFACRICDLVVHFHQVFVNAEWP